MPRQGILASWEEIRNTKEVHWAMECFAEMVRFDIYLRHRSDSPSDSWEYSFSFTLVSRLSSKFVRILLIIDDKGVGSGAGWVIGNTIKLEGLSSMSCNKYDLLLWWLSSLHPQLSSRSVSPIHSESFLPSTFVLQHQGAISTPPLPSPSAFSRSSLCLRLWGEIEDKKYGLITLKFLLTQIHYRTNPWRLHCMSFRVQSMEGVNRWIASIDDGCRTSPVRRDPVHAQRSSRNLRPIFVARANTLSRLHERICQRETLNTMKSYLLIEIIYLNNSVP